MILCIFGYSYCVISEMVRNHLFLARSECHRIFCFDGSILYQPQRTRHAWSYGCVPFIPM